MASAAALFWDWDEDDRPLGLSELLLPPLLLLLLLDWPPPPPSEGVEVEGLVIF